MCLVKNAFFCVLGHFWAYVGHPWATSMPFTLINPTYPRTNPKNFHEKTLRIGDFEKLSFFESAILNFFCFIPMKTSQSFWLARMGQNFDQAKRDNTFWPMLNILKGSVVIERVCLYVESYFNHESSIYILSASQWCRIGM